MTRSSRAEIAVSLLIIAACLLVILETFKLPPGSFEPLGSAPVPQATAGIIIALCCVVIWFAAARGRAGEADGIDEEAEEPGSAAYLFLISIAYVGGLHTARIDFGVLTTAFLFLSIWGLERFRISAVLPAAAGGAIVGFGGKYIFTKIFVVDLPSWF